MPNPLLPNATITTQRPTFNAGTKLTTAGATYLSGVIASVSEIDQVGYARLAALGEGALSAEYQMNVASGTDIAIGDRITAITRLVDGAAWPTDLGPSAQVIWQVIYVRESSPGFLAERVCFIKRLVGSGPTH